MARVPTAQQSVQRTPLNLPTPQPVYDPGRGISPAAFGAAEGRAAQTLGSTLGQIGDVTTKIALTEQAENDSREAKMLDLEFRRAVRDITEGTDTTPGFYGTRGQSTLDAAPPTREAIAQARETILSGISNDRVRSLVELSTAARMEDELDSMGKFSTAQRLVANEEISQARAAEAVDFAAKRFFDDEAIATSILTAQREAADLAAQKGGNEEVQLNAAEAAATEVVKQTVLAAMRTGNLDRAREVFERNIDFIDGDEAANIAGLLRNAQDVAASQAAAEQALADNPGDITAARKWVRDNYEGQIEADAIREIDKRVQEEQLQQKLAIDQLQGDAAQAITDGTPIAQWAMENPEAALAARRDPAFWNQLHVLQDRAARNQIFAPTSDGTSFSRLSTMTQDELLTLNPDNALLKSKLTADEYDRFLTLHRAAQRRREALPHETALFNNARSSLKRLAPTDWKWGTKDVSNDDQRKINAAELEMDAWMQEQLDAGKQPTQVEINARAARLLLQIEADPSFWWNIFTSNANDSFEGIAAQREELSTEQRAVARVPRDKIPTDLMNAILNSIDRNGKTASDDLIEQLAGAEAMGDKARMRRLLGIK